MLRFKMMILQDKFQVVLSNQQGGLYQCFTTFRKLHIVWWISVVKLRLMDRAEASDI